MSFDQILELEEEQSFSKTSSDIQDQNLGCNITDKSFEWEISKANSDQSFKQK